MNLYGQILDRFCFNTRSQSQGSDFEGLWFPISPLSASPYLFPSLPLPLPSPPLASLSLSAGTKGPLLIELVGWLVWRSRIVEVYFASFLIWEAECVISLPLPSRVKVFCLLLKMHWPKEVPDRRFRRGNPALDPWVGEGDLFWPVCLFAFAVSTPNPHVTPKREALILYLLFS